MFQDLVAAKPPRFAGKAWAEMSNPGLNSIVGVRDAAIAASAAHFQVRIVEAFRSLMLDLLLVAVRSV
ncbi:MAG: hypothetical protein M5U07_19445 [Xanthobacteraceae bacterium]|nr:hypothetical protein [Xanthobacteraceae bacterium]